MRRLTIIGTDTGIGKTYVSVALIQAIHRRGGAAMGLKPIESGVVSTESSDADRLAIASRRALDKTRLVCFPDVMAPGLVSSPLHDLDSVVAFVEQQTTQWQAENQLERASQAHEYRPAHAQEKPPAGPPICLVETAGGWLSPLTPTLDVRDLAVRLANSVLLVGPAGLGAINQIRLTLLGIANTGLEVTGIVLSKKPEIGEEIALQNQAALTSRTGLPVWLLGGAEVPTGLVQSLASLPTIPNTP